MKIPAIWVTIGQRGISHNDLEHLRSYPIDGIRINTGRSSYNWIYQAISILIELGYSPNQIFLDIGNQKTRVTFRNNDKITFHIGDCITVYDEYDDNADFWLEHNGFLNKVSLNDVIYFSDGEIQCNVIDIQRKSIKIVFQTDCTMATKVAMGIVGRDFSHFEISNDEIINVNNILAEYPISLILAFVENANNIIWARTVFPLSSNIVPKIETNTAIENITSITRIVNSVFVGRGDLGLSVGIEKVGVLQKYLISSAHNANCNIAIGTGILESLRWNQFPLRAEVADITNLCYDGADIIVLTAETANAKNPFRSIDFLIKELDYMSKI